MHLAMIEGLGDESASTASDKQYRFCYAPQFLDDQSTVDPDSLYKHGLLMWPSELSQEWDPIDSRVSLGSQNFEFRGTGGDTGLKSLLYRQNHTSAGILSTSINSTDTVIIVSAPSLTNTIIYLEREAIKLGGSVSGSGPYTYTGCLRGRLGTIATSHGSEARDDNNFYTTCNTLEGRIIRLVEVDLDASSAYATESTLWTYVIRNISSPDGGSTISISTDSLLSVLFSKQIYKEDVFRVKSLGQVTLGSDEVLAIFLGTKDDNPIGEDFKTGMPAGGSQSATSSATGSFLGLVNNKYLYKCTYNADDQGEGKQFYPSSELPRVATERFGRGASPSGADFDRESFYSTDVREVFSTNPNAPSNMNTPGTNTLPLSQNPGELIMQLLTTTTNNNISGTNGSYDTGVNALSGGIRYDFIDEDQILSWADELGDGYDFSSYYIGLDDEELTIGQAIDSIAAVFQSSVVQLSNGKIGMARFKDLAKYGSSASINNSNILNIGDLQQDRRIFDTLDRVTIEYALSPGLSPSTVNTSDIIKYRRLFNREHGEMKFTAHGLHSDEQVIALAQRMVQRWHEPIPMVFMDTNHLENHSVGDMVLVSHDYIFGNTGNLGVTSRGMLVVSKQQEFGDSEHFFKYSLMDVSAIYSRSGYIAPSAKVASYDSASKTITLVQNEYTATYSSKPNDPLGTGSDRRDVDGFKSNDVVDIVNQYFSAITGSIGIAISSVDRANNRVVLASSPTTDPVSGDILRPAKYAQCATSQQNDWVYVSDASDELDGDDGKSYVY